MNEISKWFRENTDKWSQEGIEIIFHVPVEEVPPEAIEVADAYKKCCENSQRRTQLLHSLGIGIDNNWE